MSDTTDDLELPEVPAPEKRPVTDEDIRGLLDKERRTTATLRAEREAAEARANAAQHEVQQARGAAASSHLAQFRAREEGFEAQLASAEAEATALTDRLASAFADGDHASAAQLQRKIATAEARIESLRVQRGMVARDREAVEAALKAPQPAAQPAGQDLSQYAPAERVWLREHPEFLTDQKLRYKVVAAINDALGEGLPAMSPEYFDRLTDAYNTYMGTEPAAPREPAPERRAAPAALPAGRRTAPATTRADGPVRLTPDEREAADISMGDIPVADYLGADGKTMMPGRYRSYKQMQASLLATGRLGARQA